MKQQLDDQMTTLIDAARVLQSMQYVNLALSVLDVVDEKLRKRVP